MVIRGARYAPSQERETPPESTKKRAPGRAKITARLVSRCVDSIDQIDPKLAFAGDPWNTLGITGWRAPGRRAPGERRDAERRMEGTRGRTRRGTGGAVVVAEGVEKASRTCQPRRHARPLCTTKHGGPLAYRHLSTTASASVAGCSCRRPGQAGLASLQAPCSRPGQPDRRVRALFVTRGVSFPHGTRTFRRRTNFPHGSAFPPTRDRRRA